MNDELEQSGGEQEQLDREQEKSDSNQNQLIEIYRVPYAISK